MDFTSIWNNLVQPFDQFALIAGGISVFALVYALVLALKIRAASDGTPEMRKIARLIQKGAMTFLLNEYLILFLLYVPVVAVLLHHFIDRPLFEAAHAERQFSWDDFTASGTAAWEWIRDVALFGGSTISFITGACASAFSGFCGMVVATRAAVRTTEAAKTGLSGALKIAFQSGTVTGLSVVGLGCGFLVLLFVWKGSDGTLLTEATVNRIVAFGFGASSIALFARVGGGIFTKAADVGADLVGKLEAGIPEDDPRNPAVIADNVGDNVGDVAGMGADLFESYVGCLIAAMVIGAGMHVASEPGPENWQGLSRRELFVLFPLLLAGVGTLASIVGTFFVSSKDEKKVHKALERGLLVASVVFAAGAVGLAYWMFPGSAQIEGFGRDNPAWLRLSIAVISGLALGVAIGKITEYYTSDHYRSVKEIAFQSQTGAATNIIHGLAVGMRSTVVPVVLCAVAILIAYKMAGYYGIAISAVGMLSTLGISLGVDAYGPVADNAGGLAEMTHCGPEVRARTDSLDKVGNTTAAIGKGFAIGSAALTALALFSSYATTANLTNSAGELSLNVLDPKILAGLMVGAVLPFLFCAMSMKSVGKAANSMIKEVRDQFRKNKGILEGTVAPNYKRCIGISTRAALREMALPGLLAVTAPLAMGLFLGTGGLGGLLVGSLLSGVTLAIFMANAGGAWDNAKKYIEGGEYGGKGSETHKAAVVGDTVGDPFKDTSGPSLNILIKLMSIVSLVMVPFLVKFGEENGTLGRMIIDFIKEQYTALLGAK